MRRLLVVLILSLGAAGAASAQNLAGDWQGTLKPGEAELRLVLHITKADDGSWKGTLDSLDQGANGIPVTSISLKESKLTFTVEPVNGSYEGTVNADATEISGTWTQGQSLPLDFKKTTTPAKAEHAPAKASDIDGAWMGTLDAGAAKLRIVFHITNTADGLTATMDSPDQNIKGLPVTKVTRDGSSLKLELKQIPGVFQGTIDKDRESVNGTWSQSGNSLPLQLKRVKDSAELERPRPQNPTKPYPYREEEVSFENSGAGIKLAGTLTIPPGKGPFPAVVLVAGSGAHDRDEALMGHRPFLVLSDYLTRRGIAVLRYDKRGVGESGGTYGTATTADFADDAEAGLAYLETRAEVDRRKIGLIGHSEGGMIAPLLAARNSSVAFIVMMAGPGVPGDELLVEQTLMIAEANGQSHETAEKAAGEERIILSLVKDETDSAVLEKKLREQLTGQVPEAQIGAAIKSTSSPWFRYFISYDPAAALRKVKCPVLAVVGSKDLQVPPEQNIPAIRKALQDAGNQKFEIDELPGLNHLFQTAKTGSPAEYAQIEETISPIAMEKIAAWVAKQ
ncbi:MAG TPA: alpha/beta hydrolase [Candidatus Acidoferrales bacterium]|nr:alpha/beta hydrolase [Candidatus Acidoferrales bacterium]